MNVNWDFFAGYIFGAVITGVVILMLTGCMSAARLERGPGKDDCLATVTGSMPSFLTPAVVAECRPEVK